MSCALDGSVQMFTACPVLSMEKKVHMAELTPLESVVLACCYVSSSFDLGTEKQLVRWSIIHASLSLSSI